jgi:orotidine-5'-phosphate decarboxylase
MTERKAQDLEPIPQQSEFVRMLEAKWSQGKFLCIGLDSSYLAIPDFIRKGAYIKDAIFDFNREIIDATADLACAYKPNAAFYEEQGPDGIIALESTVRYIKENYPDTPVIYDAKRGDIHSTNEKYARFAFDRLDVDAITPLFGSGSLISIS